MADDTNSDLPPEGTEFTPAVPLQDAGATFESDAAVKPAAAVSGIDSRPAASAGPGSQDDPAQGAADAFREQAQKFVQDAQDRARTYAIDGKTRATGALDEVSKVMNDAADTIDEKLGAQYGQYARSAAEYVDGFARSLDEKSVDDLVEDARNLIQKSPAIAIGTAAAVGFILARLVRSGIDADRHGA